MNNLDLNFLLYLNKALLESLQIFHPPDNFPVIAIVDGHAFKAAHDFDPSSEFAPFRSGLSVGDLYTSARYGMFVLASPAPNVRRAIIIVSAKALYEDINSIFLSAVISKLKQEVIL